MNNIDEFRDALAAHLLSKHNATDEQIEDKSLAEVVALHEHSHREGEYSDHHGIDSLEIGPLTKVFIFDLPVQVFGFSPADALRRFSANGLTDGEAVIKQGAVQVQVVYINADFLDVADVKFNYDYPIEEQRRGS